MGGGWGGVGGSATPPLYETLWIWMFFHFLPYSINQLNIGFTLVLDAHSSKVQNIVKQLLDKAGVSRYFTHDMSHTCTTHVTYLHDMSHACTTCHMHTRHVTYIHGMSHAYTTCHMPHRTCHMYMSHTYVHMYQYVHTYVRTYIHTCGGMYV